jgi:hypothetical protein
MGRVGKGRGYNGPVGRAAQHRSELEVEVSRRGRELLVRRGVTPSGDVITSTISVMTSQGDLMVERVSDYRMLYAESPNGTVIRSSLPSELQWALDEISRLMVLDDLGDI